MEENWVKGLTFMAAGIYLLGFVTGSGIAQICHRIRNKTLPLTLLAATTVMGILCEVYALNLFKIF